ncbi:MAG: tetratricopeptide repeat protein, partial [Xanthobacteraceae bacterium]
AYLNRGNALFDKKDFDRAVADYGQAIAVDPKNLGAYYNRGNAYKNKGDYAKAITDYSAIITRDPNNLGALFSRGRLALATGDLQGALADLAHATSLAPKDAYAALWLDIANKRGNRSSALAEAAKQLDMTRWPAPAVRLYLGEITADAALAAADNSDAAMKKRQLCDINFFIGELDLHAGKKDDATRHFRQATDGCPDYLISYEGAKAELKALGAL